MIKVIFWALALISFDVVYGQTTTFEIAALENNPNDIKAKIKDLHLKKFKWFASQQFDSLTTLLHDDVFYIHSNGWQESKSEVIENIKSGKLNYSDVKVHESHVRVMDKTAVVTGKGTFYVIMEGKPYEFNLFYTEVYVISDSGIKLISRHACKY
jgi:Domain of unknown function (DUF4440)